MFSSKSLFLFLVIFCSITIQYGNGSIQGKQELRHFKRGFLYVGKRSFDEGNLIFTICARNTSSLAECNVVQKVFPSSEIKASCLVTLKGDHDESHIRMIIDIVTLGKDKAIIFWEEDYNKKATIKIGTVNLKTCQTNEAKISDPQKVVLQELFYTDKVVKYDDDSFDFFFHDPERYGDKLCRMQINADGTVKSEPIASNITGRIVYISPIATRSPSKGYAYVKRNEDGFTLFLVKPNGAEKQLAIYKFNDLPIVSASNNVVSACTRSDVNSGITCTQYDEYGNTMLKTSVSKENKDIQHEDLYNLPGGGMIVMLSETKQTGSDNRIAYSIVKINTDGKISESARTKELDNFSSKRKRTYVYRHGDSEYCATMISMDPFIDGKKINDYEILHECVEKSLLAV